ncbi:MAG: NF038122 family metalloprotease, partial [Cyanobacteria bacterium P01_F01_bin.150]
MTQFNFTFQPGISLEQMIGFEMAGQIWSQFSSDDVEVSIHISTTKELPTTVIGGAIPVYIEADVATLRNALIQDATSAQDAIAIQNLNVQIGDDGVLQYSGMVGDTTQQSSQVTLTQANAKALGLSSVSGADASFDGHIVLNSLNYSRYSWNYNYARTSAASRHSLDFLSVAMHEVGHVMGFISGVDTIDKNAVSADLTQTSLLDLYRYSDRSVANNAQELTAGQSAYFSIDGGQTSIADFAKGVVTVIGGVEGYQASHWANNTLGGSITKNSVETSTAELATDFLTSLFAIATPASASDQVSDITQLLASAGQSSVLGNQASNVMLDTNSSNRFTLGIMDPTLAPGERSKISALDLLAMDVLGYDMTGASTDFNYKELLGEAEEAIAQKLGISVEDLRPKPIEEEKGESGRSDWTSFFNFRHNFFKKRFNPNTYASVDTGALTQDRWQDVLSAINESAEIYERRRRKRSKIKKSKASFWQEDGLDSTVVNIISDRAGESAEILADAGSPWVTVVEALPYAPLILRTLNLVGNDANDLIIPALDKYQAIAAGNGDNVVQLGKQGGVVTAGDGHDTIMSMGGRITIDAGDGDNVIVLDDQQSGQRTVTTGKGHDYVNITGTLATVTSGAGNDVVVLNRTNTSSSRGTFTVTAAAGDNTIKLDGGTYTQQTVTTGDGHDTIEVQGASGTITSGDGNDVIIAKPGKNASNGTFTITATGGDNIVQVDSGTSGRQTITTGQGNDQIQFTSLSATVTTGAGDDVVVGDRANTSSASGTFIVNSTAGNNRIHLNGGDYTQHTVTTGEGDDTISITGRISTVMAGSGDNTIQVNSSNTSSSHTIITGDGNDTVSFTGVNATVKTGAGNDIIDGTHSHRGSSTYTIDGGDGNNTIQFTAEQATITAGTGNDTIIGDNISTLEPVRYYDYYYGYRYRAYTPTYTVNVDGGDNAIQLKGSKHQIINITTGDGNDTLDITGKTLKADLG